jgi:hypothetical protein
MNKTCFFSPSNNPTVFWQVFWLARQCAASVQQIVFLVSFFPFLYERRKEHGKRINVNVVIKLLKMIKPHFTTCRSFIMTFLRLFSSTIISFKLSSYFFHFFKFESLFSFVKISCHFISWQPFSFSILSILSCSDFHLSLSNFPFILLVSILCIHYAPFPLELT